MGTLARTAAALLLSLTVVAPPRPAAAADAVTEWTLLADRLGQGAANFRTLAIMHMAMHDALNAARPAHARWAPPEADEPAAEGALPEAAMVAAAVRALSALHPEAWPEIDAVFRVAFARLPPDEPARGAGLELGRAVADTAVSRRRGDGSDVVIPFPVGDGPGEWRPVPQDFLNSSTSSMLPFLLDAREVADAPTPPALGSEAFLRDLEEVRWIGGEDAPGRTLPQVESAIFWAFQSSQRGFVNLAVALLDAAPRAGGMPEHARIMSRLAAAMADSAVIIWREKERFGYWRPIAAIRSGGPGFAADRGWLPLLETPPHPEYPSGHAADCFVGATVLRDALPELGEVTYFAQPSTVRSADLVMGMGQHEQLGDTGISRARRFPSIEAAAEECAESRILAGAHFRSSVEEARRVGSVITARAATRAGPLP